jgi:hypothetical protein
MANVQIVLDTLECNATTEAGADEVYVLVFGTKSDGQKFGSRVPGEGRDGHWNMNDGNQPTDAPEGDSHRITNKVMFTGDLQPGESWDVVFMVMEEDGGSSKTAQAGAADMLSHTGNPFAVLGGLLLGALNALGFWIDDTDDYIGSFATHITNDGGSINVIWRTVDRVTDQYKYKNGWEFDMNGDGSSYKLWTYYK